MWIYSDGRKRMLLVAALVFVLAAGVHWATGSKADSEAEVIESGERLVHNMDCNVCHTPKVMTPQGPRPDPSRLLSGHPADEKVPNLPKELIGPTKWGGLFNNSTTAWAGPWGVSFGSNLTPDMDTGIGGWTEEIFVECMRTGKHMEGGRPFLPPMPTYSRLNDGELHAIYAYLKSIKPVQNSVPEPLPPLEMGTEK